MFSFVILTFLSNMIKIKTWVEVRNYRKIFFSFVYRFYRLNRQKYRNKKTRLIISLTWGQTQTFIEHGFRVNRACLSKSICFIVIAITQRSLWVLFLKPRAVWNSPHTSLRRQSPMLWPRVTGPGHTQLPVGSRTDKTWRHVALS